MYSLLDILGMLPNIIVVQSILEGHSNRFYPLEYHCLSEC